MYTVAIIGSRTFTDFERADTAFQAHYLDADGNCWVERIVSGCARGADTIAEQLAEKYNVGFLGFPADWSRLGKGAGFARNKQIIDACDSVLCFWDGISKGTAHSLSLAKKAKKNTIIIYF